MADAEGWVMTDDLDKQILQASRAVRSAYEKFMHARAAVETAKRTVASLEKEAEAAAKQMKEAERHMRDLTTGGAESQVITYRERPM